MWKQDHIVSCGIYGTSQIPNSLKLTLAQEWSWVGVPKRCSSIYQSGIFLILLLLVSVIHLYIWQVSLQPSYRDTFEIWMWHSIGKQCFGQHQPVKANLLEHCIDIFSVSDFKSQWKWKKKMIEQVTLFCFCEKKGIDNYHTMISIS